MIRVRCPICDRLMQGPGKEGWPAFPFCSERCRLIDLGRWIDGRYAIEKEAHDEGLETTDDENSIP